MKSNIFYLVGCSIFANPLTVLAESTQDLLNQSIAAKPNVVFIISDDLAYFDIEAFGQQIVKTPNLNRMMENGKRFMNFYGAAPISTPSRASLMTGQHSGYTKIRDNSETKPDGQMELDQSVKILPQMFKEAGYVTGAFGKWGLGGSESSTRPCDVGFDRFYGYMCQFYAHTYYPSHLWSNNERILFPQNFVEEFNKSQMTDGYYYTTHYGGKLNKTSLWSKHNQRVTYSGDVIQENVLKFIRDNKDNSFFAYLAYTLPHAGAEQPNDSLVQMYRGRICEVSSPSEATGSMYAASHEPRAQYSAMISRLDTYVGQVLDELENQGILDNTLVIFTSDNGPSTEGGRDVDFSRPEGAYRGYKRNMYEGGIHVPMIAMWPGKIVGGTSTNLHSALYDIMPTFVELVGLKDTWTQETQGISIVPTLIDEGNQSLHNHLYFEFSGQQAVRKGKWKLIRTKCNNPENQIFELYDLEKDKAETNNLVSIHPDIKEELYQIMKSDRVAPISNFNSIRFID